MRKSVFAQQEGPRAKTIQNKTILGARSLSPTKVFKRIFSNAHFSFQRGCFLPETRFFERIYIFIFSKKEGDNLTESAMPYYSEYV